jgi:hypothetical protein
MVDVPARRSVRIPIGFNDPTRTVPILASGALVVESVATGSDAPPDIVVERTTAWDVDGIPRSRSTSIIGNFKD